MPSLIHTRAKLAVPLLSILLSRIPSTFAFTQCYYPDGSIPVDYIWEPCTSVDGKVSSCCIPSEGDICQENGLCYYPLNEQVFRGTCTDRTWNDPACLGDICVTGYENTWSWVTNCKPKGGGDNSYVCGSYEDKIHATANCSANFSPQTAFRTELPSTPASRYTSPPAIDTSLYSVYTISYTTIISAWVQTTTFTSTFESTFTSTLSQQTTSGYKTGSGSVTGTSGATSSGTSAPVSSPSDKSSGITISPGVLVAVIAGPILLLALLAFIFFFIRKKRSLKREDGIRLNSAGEFPPPNGPVGSDQTHPYEVSAAEAKNGFAAAGDKKYIYTSAVSREPSPGAVEMVGVNEKGYVQQHQAPYGVVEAGGAELRSPRSPAPVYTEQRVVMPVEMDGNSSVRGR